MVGAFCMIASLFIGMALLLSSLPAQQKTNGTESLDYLGAYRIPLGIALIGTTATSVFLYRYSRRFLGTAQERTGVMIYRAYEAVSDFIDSNLKDGHRKIAKNRLENLIYYISLWKGNAPPTLYEPINELTKSMRDKLIHIIQNSKDEQEIYEVRTFLHTFLATVDQAVTWDAINVVINQLNLITVRTPQKLSKPARQILREFPNLKFLIISAVSGAAVFGAMVSLGAPNYAALGAAVAAIVGLVAGLPQIFKKS